MSRDLVVLSHLRWAFVWQRPQHLISRLADGYDRTWFVEEPLVGTEPDRARRPEQQGDIVRGVRERPRGSTLEGFEGRACALYPRLLPKLVGRASERTAWIYTPMVLDVARALAP